MGIQTIVEMLQENYADNRLYRLAENEDRIRKIKERIRTKGVYQLDSIKIVTDGLPPYNSFVPHVDIKLFSPNPDKQRDNALFTDLLKYLKGKDKDNYPNEHYFLTGEIDWDQADFQGLTLPPLGCTSINIDLSSYNSPLDYIKSHYYDGVLSLGASGKYRKLLQPYVELLNTQKAYLVLDFQEMQRVMAFPAVLQELRGGIIEGEALFQRRINLFPITVSKSQIAHPEQWIFPLEEQGSAYDIYPVFVPTADIPIYAGILNKQIPVSEFFKTYSSSSKQEALLDLQLFIREALRMKMVSTARKKPSLRISSIYNCPTSQIEVITLPENSFVDYWTVRRDIRLAEHLQKYPTYINIHNGNKYFPYNKDQPYKSTVMLRIDRDSSKLFLEYQDQLCKELGISIK